MVGTFNGISYVEHLGSTRICNLKVIPRNKHDSSYFVLFYIFWQICPFLSCFHCPSMIKSKDLFKMHVLSDFTDLSRTFRHCMCVKSIVFVVAHYIVNTLPTLM